MTGQNKIKLMPAAAAAGLASGLFCIIAAAVSMPVWAMIGSAAVSVISLSVCGAGLLAVSSGLKRFTAVVSADTSFNPAIFKDTVMEEAAFGIGAYLEKSQEDLQQFRQQCQDLSLQNLLLRRRRNSAEAILNSIRDAVVVTDEKDRVVLANHSAEKLFGFQFDLNNPVAAEDMISCHELVWMITKSRQSKTAHVRHELTVEKDRDVSTYDAVLSGTADEDGQIVNVVTVLHDVTREKEIAQMKNDFVSHVSHELKTPLASINAYAEMLVDGEAEDPETMKQFCEVIQGQAQRLSRLIEDILNISRIESGMVKVSKETHSLALIIRDAVEMIKSYAQEKNISVQSPEPILYDQVYIDRDMVSQVVVNLLSNAVKYTPANGHITVKSELDEVQGMITVTVTDTGVGIPAEDVEHVFDKFYRVQANNKYAKGTGLGLNLVKQIVETVHGGSVFVTSKQGEGSTFGFVLPLSRQEAAQTT